MAVVRDKKDVSVLIETQFPEFVTEKHPKFKKFIEKYYEFMESHQLYFGTTFTFDEDKLVDESDGTSYFLYEDGVNSIQLESERDTENDANVQFTIGETLTGNTSQATAVVTGTKGNTVAFIKPSNDASFKYGEKVTGSATRAYATLANGVVDGTFPNGSIESFRSRGAGVAVRDLPRSQDIDLASEGLIDAAWKKEFYVNIPKTATTDRRQLLKQMKKVYRAKGNESSFHWLFRTLYAKTVGHVPGVLQEIEFYYPGTDLLKLSDGKWVLDKTIKFVTTTGTNISLFTGRKITGGTSGCTALVESQISYAAGALDITELTLSNIVQGVVNGVLTDYTSGEIITSETDSAGLYATATTTGVVQTITVDVGGTNYVVGDEIHITKGGGAGARARVTSIKNGVVDGINIIDSGDGYSVGDTLNFINEETDGSGAAGTVKSIIKTAEVLKNTDLIQTNQVTSFRLTELNAADYGSTFVNHNANTHLFGNSSLIFSASIKPSSGKLYNVQNDYNAASHILAGDRIAKQASINTFDPATGTDKTITQSVRTVTLSSGLSETEKIDVVGGKLVYANGKINIITGFSSNTVLLVRDDLSFGVGENFNINYASNTYWGTIISASATEILYSVGSHYRDSDLGTLTVQNFVNDDTIIIYDSKFTKLGAAAAASGIDAHNMHNGVTFQVGNTPISNTTSSLHNGAFNMTTVDIGAIDTFTLSSGGVGYTSSPPVSVANSYIPTLGNALDVVGAPNTLLNLNLHSYDSGTIAQNGTIITLDADGSFPDANSGVLTLTYANGTTAQIIAVTNSSTLSVSTEKVFGLGIGTSPDRETYSLSYMAHANNFTRNTLLYNDDYSARGRVLDFIDKSTDYLKLSRIGNPVIANGNTTLRVDMTTAQDFGSVAEQILLESKTRHKDQYGHQKLLLEGDIAGGILTETCVKFLSQENGTTDLLLGDVILQEDGTTNTPNFSIEGRIYTEDTTGDRVTAHSNSVSTYITGTITQSGTTVTGVGTVFPNDFVRGTITYANDATSTITGYTNATSFTVEDSKTIGSAQAYSISYNPALTWGTSRNITVSAGGTGNRTVTVTEYGHYLRTGDKVKISGSGTAIFNGVWPITSVNNTTYTYTLPENTGVTSPVGTHKATPVVSAWSATSNAVTTDTSVKGKNAVIEVSSVEIGAIKEVGVYNFGAGYLSSPTLSTTSGGQDATFTSELGALTTYGGYNLGTTGTLSGVPKLQDNRYYQAFSYVLKSDFDVSQYRDAVKRITHPSGMIMFGEVAIRSNLSARLFNTAVNTVDDLGTIERVGPDNSGRKYHNITLFQNAVTTDVQFQSYGSNNELEIYTADHPWQAMNARLETDDSVNLMLELYEEIDSIARTNSTMHTVTQTSHGLETGDVIEFSGAYPGYSSSLLGDQFTGQEWQGEHVIITAPTTNTYTITPRKDDGVGQMYDGYLYIQLEDQATGNNIITEDYSNITFMVWDNTGNNDSELGAIETDIDVGDSILLEDGNLYAPSESTEGVLLFDAVEAPVTTHIQLDGQAISNENLRLEDDSGNILREGIPDNPGNIITEKIVTYEIFILEEGTIADLGMTGSGYLELQDASSISSSDEVKDSRYGDTKYLLTEYSYTGDQIRVPGDYLLIEGHGIPEFLIMETLSSVEERVPTVSVLSGNLLMQPTNYLRARTVSYANTFRASATNWDDPFSGVLIGQDTQQVTLTCTTTLGNTTITTSDTSPIVVGMAVRGTGIPTIPVANVATITNSTTFQLSEKATVSGSNSLTFDLEFEILLERGGTYLYPKLQFPEAETGTISIDMSFNSDLLLEDDNGAYGWGYILDEESGSMGNGPQRYISLEEDTQGVNHQYESIPYMETKPTIDLIDSMGFHLITEDNHHFIEEGDERNRLSRFVTGERYIHIAPVYQFIDYLNTVGRLLTENDELLIQENESYTPGELHYDVQQGYLSLESLTSFTDQNNEVQVEFHLEDSMDSHIITENYEHFIEEGDDRNRLSRFVTGESHVKPSTREIEYNYPNGNPGLDRLTLQAVDKVFPSSEVFSERGINDWKDTNIATVPYGMQAFRPHYYSQWASIDLGFVDGQFEMEDNTGIILLEHPVTNQDKLIQEDFPGVQEDIFTTDKARFDFILLEGQLGTDNGDGKYLTAERGEDVDRILLETSVPGPASVVDLVQEIALEDFTSGGSGYIQLEQGAPDSADFYDFGYLISEETPPSYGTRTGHQSWTVLPAYQYSRIPTRLNGLIDIANGGTTVTGSEYCSFTTQLKVGEEFQTEDVRIIAEDSGGDVVLETDERLEHEDITLGDADAFVLDTAQNIRLQDFRWLISQENDVIAAHSSHTNVQGVYLERYMSLDDQDDSYISVGESSSGTNIGSGGNEATAWDTNDESFWIPTHESNDGAGITRVVSGSDDGKVRVESLEWENVNMIWEDFSKQLIIEPQAFIVGSITNDSSMTVTRKHLGGIEDAEYRL